MSSCGVHFIMRENGEQKMYKPGGSGLALHTACESGDGVSVLHTVCESGDGGSVLHMVLRNRGLGVGLGQPLDAQFRMHHAEVGVMRWCCTPFGMERLHFFMWIDAGARGMLRYVV